MLIVKRGLAVNAPEAVRVTCESVNLRLTSQAVRQTRIALLALSVKTVHAYLTPTIVLILPSA